MHTWCSPVCSLRLAGTFLEHCLYSSDEFRALINVSPKNPALGPSLGRAQAPPAATSARLAASQGVAGAARLTCSDSCLVSGAAMTRGWAVFSAPPTNLDWVSFFLRSFFTASAFSSEMRECLGRKTLGEKVSSAVSEVVGSSCSWESRSAGRRRRRVSPRG